MKNGPLAQIWLASNLNTINRNIAKTNILESVEEIAKAAGVDVDLDHSAVEPITLRASGELLHGVVRVYSQKASFLLNDISDLLTKIKSIFRGNSSKSVTLQVDTVAKLDQLLLQDAVTGLDVLVLPSLDFLDDIEVPEGFLNGERSMERQVQGAAPVSDVAVQQQAWDMSLEMGRRFLSDADDGLEHETSHLNLDFDLGDSNHGTNTKSWGEGTHNTVDDDLPPVTDDWDLGLGDDDVSAGNASDRSVELGRRAEMDNTLQDDSHLDFDLGLPKEPVSEYDAGMDEEGVRSVPVQPAAARKRRRNSALINVKKVVLDDENELNDRVVKDGPSEEIMAHSGKPAHATTGVKRTLADLTSDLDFLPDEIVTNLLDVRSMKRARVLHQSRKDQESDMDMDMDISLGLDESLVHNSDPIDHQQIDFDRDGERPMFGDDEQHGVDASDDNVSVVDDYSEIQPDDFAIDSSIDENPNDTQQKVELNSGELASKSTVIMASLLRDELNTGESSFEQILKARYNDEILISKRMASRAFFEILALATADCIGLKQDETFGEITIASKANLYEKFVAA